MSSFSQRVCSAAKIFEQAEEQQVASIDKAEVTVQELHLLLENKG
mgnify:CR=1 FL=1